MLAELRPEPHPLHARLRAAGVKMIVASHYTGKSPGWISQVLLAYRPMPHDLEAKLTELAELAEAEQAGVEV